MDESGDPGPHLPAEPGEKRRSQGLSPMPTYTVSAVLVHHAEWVEVFERLLNFRRWLRRKHGLPLTAEVKGSQLARGTGPWRKLGLNDSTRQGIYEWFMRFQYKQAQDLRTFAVVVWKDKCPKSREARSVGWQYAFERIETFTRKEESRVMLLPDSGQYFWVRALAGKMRRFSHVPSAYGTGPIRRPLLDVLVDDPVERDSAQSHMVQLADLNAYAAYRNRVPDAKFPQRMWSELGNAILVEANEIEAQRDHRVTPGIKDAP